MNGFSVRTPLITRETDLICFANRVRYFDDHTNLDGWIERRTDGRTDGCTDEGSDGYDRDTILAVGLYAKKKKVHLLTRNVQITAYK